MASSQIDLNKYKYIVVPTRLADFKKENQHQTSTLIAHLFSQKGFLTVYADNLPDDLNSNRCLGLYVDLINNSSMFTTKTIIKLSDCSNKEIFSTKEGRSKKKDYKEAFSEALKEAFNAMNLINYAYEKDTTDEPITVNFNNDVKTVDAKPDLKKQQKRLVDQIATEEVQRYKDKTPVASDYKKAKVQNNGSTVQQTATKEEQRYINRAPVQTDYNNGQVAAKRIMGTLYAQELVNGYQLVDSTPKIQLKIFKSSMPNVYIAKSDERDGVVYSSDGKWFFEYQEGEKVVREELTIKF